VTQQNGRTIKTVDRGWWTFRLLVFLIAFAAGILLVRVQAPSPPPGSMVVTCEGGAMAVTPLSSKMRSIKLDCLPVSSPAEPVVWGGAYPK
jgi:hypothetical protein